MDLKTVSTKELARELASREAVDKITVEPYEPYSIIVGEKEICNDGGPIVILKICD